MAEFSLSIWDYLIIVATFSVSACIGIFFACCGAPQKTSADYFLGSRRMNVVPVIISMTVTVMSAITYMGLPGEVYTLGPKFGLMFVSKFVCCYLTTTFFLPVFYRLRLVSVFDYYDKRFSKPVRYCIMIAEYAHSLIYSGVVIYVPSLALSTITGINLVLSIIAVGLVCTFYTTIGGFKAVIWTDVFQAIVMFIGFMLMIIVGIMRVGGVGEGWRRAEEGQRTELVDFDPDPTVRYTFWTIMIGGTLFYTMISGTKQAVIQRYNSCKTETQAKMVAWFGIIGMGLVEMLAVICGMVAYAFYAYCDPLTTKRIASPDQLTALFVMDLFQETPGLPGIAIAGAFCASLSSISSMINSIAAITGETIVKGYWTDLPELTYTRVIKVISASLGVISICLALLTTFMGGVIQIVLSLGGIFGGPGLGVISLGIFVPRADARSALCGLITAVAICLSLEVGSRVTGSRAQLSLPMSVEGCEATYNVSSDVTTVVFENTDWYTASDTLSSTSQMVSEAPGQIAIFSISNLHYSTISTFVTIIVGILVSYFPGNKGPQACDPAYLTPMMQKYYLKKYGSMKIVKTEGSDDKLYKEVPTEMKDMNEAR